MDILALKQIMKTPPKALKADDNIERAIDFFFKTGVDLIPIYDEQDNFMGIVTPHDIINRYAMNRKIKGRVEQFITADRCRIISLQEAAAEIDMDERITCICDDGKLVGIVRMEYLMDQLKWTNDILKQFEDRCEEYEVIFKNYYDSIYDIAADGTILMANPATKRTIGMDPMGIIGRNIREMEKDKLYFPSIFDSVLTKRETITIVQNIEADRKAIVTGVPVFGENGSITRVIAATREISALVDNLEKSTLIKDMEALQWKLQEMEETAETYFSEIRKLRKGNKEKIRIKTQNSEMKRTIEMCEKVAITDSNVLILGESGTGKDMLANFIHNLSGRSEGPLIKINCGAIPESLLESELFGYEKGAFTGANKDGKVGLIELADGGTLFLNEVGEMPLNLQVELLQVIQDKKFMRVGGSKEVFIDIRIISATNKALDIAIKNGEFREDLYYRLNVVPIEIPALRDRREDIPGLSLNFLECANKKYKRNKTLSSHAMNMLINYDWPGNVRELENLIERLVVVSENDTIYPYDFPDNIRMIDPVYERSWIEKRQGETLKDMVEDFEKEILKDTYMRYKSTIKLAEVLGVNQSTIARKMKKYNLYLED